MPSANRLGSPRKLVDDEAADHRGVRRVEHRLGADEARDDAAPVDVAHEHHGHVGGAGEAHIGDVAGLRFTSDALPAPSTSTRSASSDSRAKLSSTGGMSVGFLAWYSARLRRAEHAALHHHLRADLALRFQQHRIHVDARRHAGRPRLQRLGAADLAAIGRDGGIVRHVLRLERPDRQPARGKARHRPGHQKRLADIGAGALDHERARHVRTRCLPAPSRRPRNGA